jgi:hypothetical protein
MSAVKRLSGPVISPDLARVAARRVLVFSPTIHYRLGPGDRALVAAGDAVLPGTPIAERTPDAELMDVGQLARPEDGKSGKSDNGSAPAADEPPSPVWRESRVEQVETRPMGRPLMAVAVIGAASRPRTRRPYASVERCSSRRTAAGEPLSASGTRSWSRPWPGSCARPATP